MKTLLVGLGFGVLMAALAGCEDDPRDLDYLKDAGVKHFDAGHSSGSGGSGGSSAGSGGSGGSAGSSAGSGGSGGSAGSSAGSGGSGGSGADQDAG